MVKKIPPRFWAGILLVAVFWILNWTLSGLRTHWAFFPMWLGYILVVDSLVFIRTGTSIIKRSPSAFLLLFIVSAPAWWLFEFLNGFTNNWIYNGRENFTFIQYTLLETLSFTTVMPAVFETAELSRSFRRIEKIKRGLEISKSLQATSKMFFVGWAMLLLLILMPEYFYVFVWISVYFIIEPVNVWLGNKTILDFTSDGDWRHVLSLWSGVLICGFFWEMWNYFSYPKWIYRVPYLDYIHVFEMPLAGYLGYLPFSLELYGLYNLVSGVLFPQDSKLDADIFPRSAES